MRIRTEILEDFLKELPKDASILDVGCSNAPLYPFIREWGFNGKYIGADLLVRQLKQAKERGASPVNVNAINLPFPSQSFDLVICTEMFVHLLDRDVQRDVLREIDRVLKPGGTITLSLTNAHALTVRRHLEKAVGRIYETQPYCTYFSWDDIENLLSDASDGLKVERYRAVKYYDMVPSWFGKLRGIFKHPAVMYAADRLFGILPVTNRFGGIIQLLIRKNEASTVKRVEANDRELVYAK